MDNKSDSGVSETLIARQRDPHANPFDGCRNDHERRILQSILNQLHRVEDRDGTLNAHQFTLAFHKQSFVIRVEEILEVTTFTD